MPSVIPLHLRLAGFLSYRDPAELDFTQFDLACISGANGAGKSTLLDAMTWALFGQARRRDESLINLQSEAAEVAFTFRYEGADYRVLRSLRRGKPAVLELQIRHPQAEVAEGTPGEGGGWKPLTERTQKETQARIEQILRLDYDTFMRDYVRQMVRRYRDSPALWAWEFGNEYNLAADLPNASEHRPPVWPNLGTAPSRSARDDMTHEAIRTAFTAFAKEVRKHDSWRPITSGNAFPRPSAWHQMREHSWTQDTPEQSGGYAGHEEEFMKKIAHHREP